SDLLSRAWTIFTKNAVPYVAAVIVVGLIIVVANAIGLLVHQAVGTMLTILVMGPLALGLCKMGLTGARGGVVNFATLFEGRENIVNATLANHFISIFVAIGFVFCFLPAFLVKALYLTTYFFMLEGPKDFWGAMESSRKFVMSNFVQWLIVTVVAAVLNIAGVCLCGVGVLVSMPVTVIFIALAYDQQRHGGATTVSAEAVE
ncbi:MAG: hypothetical protein HYV26_07675, partial [Candidatus Hydrogenedentes bacterium]|nr:hypothetical protein [Candidatus Hydrogenedentota bacterium]